MKILLLAMSLTLCSCTNMGANQSGFFAGQAATDAGNAAAQASQAASQPMMFTPSAGGF